MATGVLFGQPREMIYQPGAYTQVDASALKRTSGFLYNLVAILGRGLGGKPLEPYYIDRTVAAQALFGTNTPLAEGIRFAIEGGEKGGAPVVLAMRIDDAAQATGTLAAANGGSAFSGTFEDWGAYGNTYTVSFSPGTIAGGMAVVEGKRLDGTSYYRRFDNEPSLTQLVRKVNQQAPVTLEITSGGILASQTIVFTNTEGENAVPLGLEIAISLKETTVFFSVESALTLQTAIANLANDINAHPDMNQLVVATQAYNVATFTSTLTLTSVQRGTHPNSWPLEVILSTQTAVTGVAGGGTLLGGTEPPWPQDVNGEIEGTLTFSGGYDGAPTLARYIKALEVLENIPLRMVVPMSDNLGVQVATSAHVELASSTKRRRRRVCFLGHGAGWTPQEIIARSEFFNSRRVRFVSPGFTTADQQTGFPRFYSALYQAAKVAGVRAAEGNGITDPITHTFVRNVISLETDYQANSLLLDDLIQAGVMTVEIDPAIVRKSRGFRITRDITTWRIDGVWEQGTIIDQSDFIANDIEDMQEVLFIGRPLFADVLFQLRDAVNKRLQRRTDERYIFGFDSKFTRVSVNLENQAALDCIYKIYPAPGIDFILNQQFLFPIPLDQAVA
ncbi:MAG: hypothetical protein DDT26_01748 [Dehalococcoidia bacterium]|nr:hypothetical protein [Chloroflexota bacterium]